MKRVVLTLGALLATTGTWALKPAAPTAQANAVLINISEVDLNRIVHDAFVDNGGPSIRGREERVSKHVSDLSYEAALTDPVLRLGPAGRASLSLGIVEAELRIGRLERKRRHKTATCEGAGLHVDSERPVDLTLGFRFAIEDRDLRILPEQVTVANKRGFRLEKPTHCENTLLPRWLLWRIGKGRLRKKIEGLDDVLLASVQESATALADERGLLRRHLTTSDDGTGGFYLYPQAVDTSHGSLFVSLAGSTRDGPVAERTPPAWVDGRTSSSFLGLSESFLNAAVHDAASRVRDTLHEPGVGLSKIFNSSSIYALIPGMRDVGSRENLRYHFALHDPPRIEIDSTGDPGDLEGTERAMLRIRLSGIEIGLWESAETTNDPLGSVRIDSAVLGVVPYFNPVGGISFDVLENDWRVSSRGIELDDEVLAAVLQEVFFGTIFETSFEPLARQAFDVGRTVFNPRYFSRMGQHLVIGLTEF